MRKANLVEIAALVAEMNRVGINTTYSSHRHTISIQIGDGEHYDTTCDFSASILTIRWMRKDWWNDVNSGNPYGL